MYKYVISDCGVSGERFVDKLDEDMGFWGGASCTMHHTVKKRLKVAPYVLPDASGIRIIHLEQTVERVCLL